MFGNKDDQYVRIERDAQRLANDIAQLLGTEKDEKYMKLRHMTEEQKEKWHHMQEMMKDRGKKVNKYAHEHVWQTAAIAAGVGLVIGMMSRRRRS